jgi:RNA polymerase sigma-70 factor (ECF subfamily)
MKGKPGVKQANPAIRQSVSYPEGGILGIMHDEAPRSSFSARLSARNDARAEEADLVEKCRSGDVDAYEAIYRRHATSVYGLAFRMVRNATDAEDLVQEIFLLAFNKLPTYQGASALGTWLHRVATNRCLDFLRSRAARYQSLTRSLDAPEQRDPAGPRESTSERLDLEQSIARLPDSYRAAFLLYDVQGFGHREVAEMLGVAEGTSKSLVHKARLKIREHLGRGSSGAGQ